MIRRGYLGRNIDDGSLNSHMQNGYERVQQGDLNVNRYSHVKSTALSFTVIGCSGAGKTVAINTIFSTYPQVIYHELYNFTQIVYLKIDCPFDGTLKSLCLNFFRGIDQLLQTNYEKRYGLKRNSIPTLMSLMGLLSNVHAIGVLVIDEIQHLSLSRSGGVEKMLNFFVTLVNTVGIPIILIGTPKALPMFERDLRSARRAAGFGAFYWQPMQERDSENPAVKTREWIAFTNRLWRYQWLKNRDENLSDDIRDTWYDLSQGVTDIVIKLFVLAQIRAIITKAEKITVALLTQVYKDELKPVHRMLGALRSGDMNRIIEFSDLYVPDMEHRWSGYTNPDTQFHIK